WAQMIGYTKEKLEPFTFDTWKKMIHPEDLQKCLNKIQEHFSDKSSRYECQFRMNHKKGHYIWIQDKGKVFGKTQEGKPLLMYGTHQDITQTKEASEQLERFFSLNLDLLCIADTDGNFIKVNKVWEKILGYTVEELEKRKFLEFVHPDDVESTLKAISKLSDQIIVTGFTNRYRAKDGSYRYFEWYSQPYNKLIYAVARDVTERINNQETLQESEEKFRLMFQYSPVGIFNFDKNGVLLDVNDNFVNIIGSSRKALIGLNMMNLPDKKLVRAVEEALNGRQGYYNDEYHPVTSNKSVYVKGVFTSIKDNEGNFVVGIGIFEDISEQKKNEKALIKAKEEAQAANRAKSDFLASMSHEIRTPINGVIGFSDLLKSTPLNDTQREYNDIVRQSANSLLGIINDILDFSKIEAGKFELQYEKTNLYATIDSALNLLNYKTLEKDIELLQSGSRNMPEFVYTDPLRLRQILLNLLSNAVKFTDKGEVELVVKKLNENPQKKLVRIYFAVKDTGIGIKEDQIQRILEPFNQGDNINTNKFEGTGLGLAITKTLLEKMGSQLTIESTFGKGSTFSFELRLKYYDSKPKEVLIVDEKRGTEEKDTESDTIGKKILIVEDNKINMQYLETVLRAENKNLTVLNAYDGETALDLFKKERPDAIFMDIQLPKMNGYEVTKRIRLMDKEIPIIAITARASSPSLPSKPF
ncbi:MAG: PAS domain S-box protein, partial [Thermotogota bacterium]|nr:PAS domain S-box protein [Thermotogota bacterium]